MKTLNEIKEMSELGFYSSPEKTRSIIEEFVGLPMGTMFKDSSVNRKLIFEDLAEFHDLDASVLDEITYPEMICLIEDLDNVMSPGAKNPTIAELKRLYAYQLKQLLLDAGRRNLTVSLFLGISVSALFEYLESRHNDREVGRLLERLKNDEKEMLRLAWSLGYVSLSERERMEKKEKSVAALLNTTQDIGCRRWNCWRSISDFQAMVLMANAVDAGLLGSCISSGFRERMNIEDLMEKYRDYDVCDRYEYGEEDYADNDKEDEKWQELSKKQ